MENIKIENLIKLSLAFVFIVLLLPLILTLLIQIEILEYTRLTFTDIFAPITFGAIMSISIILFYKINKKEKEKEVK